jgi:hypothetical protein
MARTLAEITSKNFGMTDNPAMVHKLNLIVAEGGLTSIKDIKESIQELKMYALTDIMLNSPDEKRQEWARHLMAREFNMGGAPYVVGSPEQKKHHNETMQVVDRAFRDNKGFGGFAMDCRGIPSSEHLDSVPPLMARFAADSAEELFIANASTNETYPGKGLHIAGVNPEKVFAPDPEWEAREKDSPFWQWTEGEGLFAGEYFHGFKMEDFADAEFMLLRGVMAVMNPGNARFELDGVNYSYVVFNRHFYPGTEAACLVPTEILQEKISEGLTPANEYRGFDEKKKDLSDVQLDYRSLKEACDEKGMNILNLTYGSVIGGGLCNAYLPESEPHYGWEKTDGGSGAWKDSWGHTHKSWKARTYGMTPRTRDLDRDLQFARDIHENVYEVTRGLQAELDAFRFALSFYKMGNTLTQERDQDQDEQEDEQFMEEEEQEMPEFDEQTVHEYRYRMLEEVYRWHLGAQEAGWSVAQTPVLHFAYVLDPNTLPPGDKRMIEIDLADMKLTTPEGEFHFPVDSDGMGEEEREIWRKQVVPYFQVGTGYEPRLLMRGGAYSLTE